MGKFIRLPSSIVSTKEKLAMSALLMCAKNDDEIITSVAVLEANLTGLTKSNRKTQDDLFEGLKALNAKGMVNIENMPGKVNDLFKVIITVKEGTFTIVYYKEIQTIMSGNYKGAVNRELFAYYTDLASFYNNKKKVAYPSIEQLETVTGLTNKTIINYNNKLKELNIIHIENNGLIKTESGVQSLRNTYSRKEHANLCKEESEKYKKSIVDKGGQVLHKKDKNKDARKMKLIKGENKQEQLLDKQIVYVQRDEKGVPIIAYRYNNNVKEDMFAYAKRSNMDMQEYLKSIQTHHGAIIKYILCNQTA
ncbi:helix-turn-helix domain-containing protein [Bacillus pacificus]|uniref:helix-turn-helix domain-containing protein n=1 Tax=Bacillus pacificus TaxID=2026187 RepID=UPI003D6562C2